MHELLKQENTSGGITRQEAVSMAPPLFLDIQSHHKVCMLPFGILWGSVRSSESFGIPRPTSPHVILLASVWILHNETSLSSEELNGEIVDLFSSRIIKNIVCWLPEDRLIATRLVWLGTFSNQYICPSMSFKHASCLSFWVYCIVSRPSSLGAFLPRFQLQVTRLLPFSSTLSTI